MEIPSHTETQTTLAQSRLSCHIIGVKYGKTEV